MSSTQDSSALPPLCACYWTCHLNEIKALAEGSVCVVAA